MGSFKNIDINRSTFTKIQFFTQELSFVINQSLRYYFGTVTKLQMCPTYNSILFTDTDCAECAPHNFWILGCDDQTVLTRLQPL